MVNRTEPVVEWPGTVVATPSVVTLPNAPEVGQAGEIGTPELDLPEGFLRAPLNRAERRHLAAVERREARAEERDERRLAELAKTVDDEEAEISAILAEHGLEL